MFFFVQNAIFSFTFHSQIFNQKHRQPGRKIVELRLKYFLLFLLRNLKCQLVRWSTFWSDLQTLPTSGWRTVQLCPEPDLQDRHRQQLTTVEWNNLEEKKI